MAFTGTTLSGAVTRDDTSVLLASISNLVVGQYGRMDQEIVKIIGPIPAAATTPVNVLRGQEGTAAVPHNTGIPFVFGNSITQLGADWQQAQAAAASIASVPALRGKYISTYVASGAIALPPVGSDAVAILNGTSVLAMTLANPSVAQDGDTILIIANGKAAHTVTITSGLGNGGASFDVGTFSATLQMCSLLVACGGFWVSVGPSGATGIAGSPTWA